MEPELLKAEELATIFSMSIKSARKLCKRNGVEPVNVSDGKRATLRWSRTAVMALLDTLQAGVKPCVNIIPRRRSSIRLVGKSAREIYALYSGGNNGNQRTARTQ